MSQASSATPSRRRTIHGQQTREAILKAAVNIASMEGLEGLSIGRLATELAMSKSGLFAHFGSKEELQLAAIETALQIYAAEVIQPALSSAPGSERLQALINAWFSYSERQVFPGGCFFAAVAVEFDSRPGPVRDRVVELIQYWLALLEQTIQEAQDLGELNSPTEAAQLAFELNALMWGANAMVRLCQPGQIAAQVKRAIAHRLGEGPG